MRSASAVPFEIRGGENLCFVPFVPERTTGHVMAWKKNRVFHSAASQFRDYIKETKICLIIQFRHDK